VRGPQGVTIRFLAPIRGQAAGGLQLIARKVMHFSHPPSWALSAAKQAEPESGDEDPSNQQSVFTFVALWRCLGLWLNV